MFGSSTTPFGSVVRRVTADGMSGASVVVGRSGADQIATRWGTNRNPDHKTVWFEIDYADG